jgi:hypothetical protein
MASQPLKAFQPFPFSNLHDESHHQQDDAIQLPRSRVAVSEEADSAVVLDAGCVQVRWSVSEVQATFVTSPATVYGNRHDRGFCHLFLQICESLMTLRYQRNPQPFFAAARRSERGSAASAFVFCPRAPTIKGFASSMVSVRLAPSWCIPKRTKGRNTNETEHGARHKLP